MKNNVVRRALICLFGVALFAAGGSSVSAGSASGTISPVVIQSGIAVFNLSSNGSGRPVCAGSQRFAFVTTNAAGQAMLSAFMTAFATGKTITIVGTNTCDAWPDSETVSYIAVY